MTFYWNCRLEPIKQVGLHDRTPWSSGEAGHAQGKCQNSSSSSLKYRRRIWIYTWTPALIHVCSHTTTTTYTPAHTLTCVWQRHQQRLRRCQPSGILPPTIAPPPAAWTHAQPGCASIRRTRRSSAGSTSAESRRLEWEASITRIHKYTNTYTHADTALHTALHCTPPTRALPQLLKSRHLRQRQFSQEERLVVGALPQRRRHTPGCGVFVCVRRRYPP
jgi:hypothetical protein